jgi:hypothetical protein
MSRPPVKKTTLPKLEEISVEKDVNNKDNISKSDKKINIRKSSTTSVGKTNSTPEERQSNKLSIQVNNQTQSQNQTQNNSISISNNLVSNLSSNLKDQNMANHSIIDIAGDHSKMRHLGIDQDSEENRHVDLAEKISSSNVMINANHNLSHSHNLSHNLRMSQQSQKIGNDFDENFLSQDEKKKMMESLKLMVMNFKPNNV